MAHIYLASPHMSEEGYEQQYVKEAFDTNWIAPLGKNVNEFEKELAAYVGSKDAAALSAGSAALHLALKAAGVKAGDIVFCQDLTFSATVSYTHLCMMQQRSRKAKNMEKKILVTRSSLPPIEEYIDEIKDIWDSHWLTNMGEKHKALQNGLKEYLGVENIDLLTNGHMALELSLQALNLQGEVITTPFTFASTTHAIVRNRLTPVFCDIRPDDFTMDADKIESLITDRTCAIMPVHVSVSYTHLQV